MEDYAKIVGTSVRRKSTITGRQKKEPSKRERRGRTMLLKYIGRDGSRNLRVGQVYDVKVFTRGASIRVSWIVPGERGTKYCAYNSPEALAKNWGAAR